MTDGHIGDHGNCTWYCAFKRPEVGKVCRGNNASEWFEVARKAGLPTGQVAEVGAIAVFDYWTKMKNAEGVLVEVNYGHVAYVEKVYDDGKFDVTEMGWETWDCVHDGLKYDKDSFKKGLIGFIFPVDNVTHFTFPSHSSQGWRCGNSTHDTYQSDDLAEIDTWKIESDGSDPSVVGPSFSKGLTSGQFSVKLSVKVEGVNSPLDKAKIYFRDDENSWNHPVFLLLSNPGDYNNGQFYDQNYNIYKANLVDAGENISVNQLRVDMTEKGSMDIWTFDWIKLVSTYHDWDFTDSQLGWTIKQHGKLADFYDNKFWRIEPTGKQPQIISPYLDNISSEYIKIGIRYSVKGDEDEPYTRVYFDIGNGFSISCYDWTKIKRDGKTKTIIFNIPSEAIGNIQRVIFDLFDDDDYENSLIAINKISFLKGYDSDDADFSIAGIGGPEPEEEIEEEPKPESITVLSQNSDYTFNTADIIEYVKPHSGYTGELVYKTDFCVSENRAGIFVKLTDVVNISFMHVTWQWYTPSGELWEEKEAFLGYTENDWYIYEYATITNATKFDGWWRVDFKINKVNSSAENVVITRYFHVHPVINIPPPLPEPEPPPAPELEIPKAPTLWLE
ncbi:MAG: CHAP domain-containing protein [Candidatus Falkowbacteria bacterium]